MTTPNRHGRGKWASPVAAPTHPLPTPPGPVASWRVLDLSSPRAVLDRRTDAWRVLEDALTRAAMTRGRGKDEAGLAHRGPASEDEVLRRWVIGRADREARHHTGEQGAEDRVDQSVALFDRTCAGTGLRTKRARQFGWGRYVALEISEPMRPQSPIRPSAIQRLMHGCLNPMQLKTLTISGSICSYCTIITRSAACSRKRAAAPEVRELL